MSRRLTLIGALGAFTGVFVFALNPLSSTILKLAFLGCLVAAWSGFVVLAWKKPIRIALLLAPVLLAVPFLLPGGEIEADELRDDYVRRMTGFEGTKYYWGGEGSRGIDCSGLPRRALRDALLAYGIRRASGPALRAYLEQWWFDASARALGEGYRGYARPIGLGGIIREMDYGDLAPGDLAVTTNRVHVLAYLGDGKWIQADPSIGAVATLDGRADDNGWFRTPVTLHRWRLLDRR